LSSKSIDTDLGKKNKNSGRVRLKETALVYAYYAKVMPPRALTVKYPKSMKTPWGSGWVV
jgi:hypothetical protein